MIFTFKKWNSFCKMLAKAGVHSVTAQSVLDDDAQQPFVVLKHDVETKVRNALKMATVEQCFGHCGSYYVQAYLLDDEKNIAALQKMQRMGHEISYHFDVMDSNHGDMEAAIAEFEANLSRFRAAGFEVNTLCQHGNPVIERIGYTSNRDFFRSEAVQSKYPELCDIMVNFPAKANKEYRYYSDAGRQFHLIFDPINNDRVDSSDKDIAYADLNGVFQAFRADNANAIISVHPHRYASTAVVYAIKTAIFCVLRSAAKLMMKLPFMKRFMSKYYYLAKKI